MRHEGLPPLSVGSLVLALVFPVQAAAQTVTGTVAGTVTDPSAQVIAGATVALTNDRTGEARTTITNEVGTFTFPAIPPGEYSVKVESSGFKTFHRTGMVLSANQRLWLGEIQLTIGAVTETIRVVAQAAQV